MGVAQTVGSPTFPTREGRIQPTPEAGLEAAVSTLRERADGWLGVSIGERIDLLTRLVPEFAGVADRWVEACVEAEGIPPANPAAGEEWLAGPYLILRNLRLLVSSLRDLDRFGAPLVPGGAVEREGRIVATVFPDRISDRVFYPPGTSAEVWMEPELTLAELPDSQAVAYRERRPEGEVCLVLGAGNVSSIGPMDALYKLFVENQVVLYKVHPVNDYLGPLLAEGFRSLVGRGVLQIVYGGAAEGSYLCRHRGVDTIHITGSDKTYDAIVFGPGPEGEARKARRQPLLDKPVTAELGNVSPVIVVPGPWRDGDIAYHAEGLVSSLANNAGFNCNATRVVIQHEGWDRRRDLLAALRRVLGTVPTRFAYYPGAEERIARFVAAHPEQSESFGEARFGHLPWTLISDLTPEPDDVCLRTEAFAGVFAELPVGGTDPVEYLHAAVELANDVIWGSLNVGLLVHPATMRDPVVGQAVEEAVAKLRYGTVSINQWAALGYGLVSTPWGAFPGHPPWDIQSGTGFVHNTLMFSRAEKTVVRVPFRVWPKPPWYVSHKTAARVGEGITRFEAENSMLRIPGVVWSALWG